MNENPNRIACSKCGAANFPSSANCWQCGEPIRVERTEPEPPPPGPELEPGATPPPPTPPSPPASPVYVPPRGRQDTETLVIVGFVCAGLALLGCCCGCCSWALSITAIVLGAIAYSKGDNRGMWVIIAGAVALVAGVVPTVFSLPFQHRFNPPWPGPFPGPWRNI